MPKNVQLYAPPEEERGKSLKSLKELDSAGGGPKVSLEANHERKKMKERKKNRDWQASLTS